MMEQNPSGIKTYLIRDRISGYCKIGKSKNPERRLKQLCQTALWHDVKFELIATINADVENFLHSLFKQERIHGEWFALRDCFIRAIRNGEWRDLYIKYNPDKFRPYILTRNNFII